MLNQLTELSISELHPLIKEKEVSPVDVIKDVFKKLESENDSINAYIYSSYEEAMNSAKIAESELNRGKYKGPLHGVPLGIKDIIHLKGVPTTSGSAIHLDILSKHDAAVVQKLKANGAVIIGKENMHSLAYGSTGDVSHFGPVRNPLNTERIAGGSSSGSAASVASHISFGSIGSDTGGSIRIPAALSGVVGMKPTFGLVSRSGTISLSPTLDTLGPITRTVEDNSILLEAISSYAHSSLNQVEEVKRIIGIPKQFYFDLIDEEIMESFDEIVRKLEAAGFKIKMIDLPYIEEFNAAHSVIFATEVYESMKEKLVTMPEKIEKEIRTRILEGYFVKGQEYISMNRVRHLAIDTLRGVLEDVDVIMTPTVGSYPGEIGERFIDLNGERMHIRGIYSRLVKVPNLTGFPALTMPIGESKNGFSNPVQLIGLPFQENILYQYATEIEKL